MTTPSPSVMVYGTLSLLKTELIAGFRTTGDVSEIFVQQDVSSPDTGLTIAEMIEEINGLMKGCSNGSELKEAHFKGQLDSLATSGSVDPNALKIILKTVYLHIHRDTKVNTKTIEYAFRVDVDAANLFKPDFDLVRIHRLTLAVWNTTDEKFTKQMALPIAT